MKDYFENLLDQLSKRSVDVVKKDILIEEQVIGSFFEPYSVREDILQLYRRYQKFTLSWFSSIEKYQGYPGETYSGYIEFIPYGLLEENHEELIEIMHEVYDVNEDELQIRSDIENWYPIFRFPNGDYFCLDGRNGEIVFFDHEIYEYEDASESLHGLIIAESINDLFEKWSRCFFVDIYDWTVGVSEKGIDLSLPVYQKFIKEWEL